MDIVNGIMALIIKLLDTILPAFGLDNSFYTSLDGALSILIDIISAASFFVPLDTLVMCISVMLLVDNFALISRIGAFVIKLIRG